MDKQNTNNKNRYSLWANEPIDFSDPETIKSLLKVLAVLVVFAASLCLPLYVSYKTQQNAKIMRIKMDMNQLRNWAEVYKIENSSYTGLENNVEIKRVFEDIKTMEGVAAIFVSADGKSFCCRTNFSNSRLGSWCIDNYGRVGDDGKCTTNHIQCE